MRWICRASHRIETVEKVPIKRSVESRPNLDRKGIANAKSRHPGQDNPVKTLGVSINSL